MVIDFEGVNNNELIEESVKKLEDSLLEFWLCLLWVWDKNEFKVGFLVVKIDRFSIFLCDLMKILNLEIGVNRFIFFWSSKEMFLLWRYFLVS